MPDPWDSQGAWMRGVETRIARLESRDWERAAWEERERADAAEQARDEFKRLTHDALDEAKVPSAGIFGQGRTDHRMVNRIRHLAADRNAAREQEARLLRERDAAIQQRDAAREQHEQCDRDRDRLRSDAAIATAEVRRLREALSGVTMCRTAAEMRAIIAAALEGKSS